MRIVSAAVCAAMTACALVACSANEASLPTAPGLAAISGGDVHAAVYRNLAASTGILATAKVTTIKEGCLAVDWDGKGENRILALPDGSKIDSSGVVNTPNMKPFRKGDTIQFTGGPYSSGDKTGVLLTVPPQCPTGVDTWYLMPLTGKLARSLAPSPNSSAPADR